MVLGHGRAHNWKLTTIFFRIQAKKPIEDLGIDFGKGYTLAGYGPSPRANLREVVGYYCPNESHADEAEVNIGIAEEPFEPISRSVLTNGGFKCEMGFDLKPTVSQLSAYAGPDENGLTKAPMLNVRCRHLKVDEETEKTKLVLFFRDGTNPEECGGTTGADSMSMEFVGQASMVERIELQSRTYVRARFKVRVKPRA